MPEKKTYFLASMNQIKILAQKQNESNVASIQNNVKVRQNT